jgi:hypothetical protein
VCFAPPLANQSLEARSGAEDARVTCEKAARKQKVAIVPYGTPGCLIVQMAWWTGPTNQVEGGCSPGMLGWQCEASSVYQSSLKLSFLRPSSSAPIAEATATIRRTMEEEEKAVFALCSGAFYQYPRAMKGEQLEVYDE